MIISIFLIFITGELPAINNDYRLGGAKRLGHADFKAEFLQAQTIVWARNILCCTAFDATGLLSRVSLDVIAAY